MSDRGLPTKKKSKKDKPKLKHESSDSTKSKRFPIVLSSDSEEEITKKEKAPKIYDNYKEACNVFIKSTLYYFSIIYKLS